MIVSLFPHYSLTVMYNLLDLNVVWDSVQKTIEYPEYNHLSGYMTYMDYGEACEEIRLFHFNE